MKSSRLRHTWKLGAHSSYEINTIKDSWNKDLCLSRSEWLIFCKKMSHLIIEELVNNKDGFILPYKLGTLIISGNKGKPINRLYSTKDKKVRYRNNHSGEIAFTCQYVFGMNRGKFKLSRLFTFKSSMALKKSLYNKIMSGEYDFYEFESMGDVKRLDVPAHIKRSRN